MLNYIQYIPCYYPCGLWEISFQWKLGLKHLKAEVQKTDGVSEMPYERWDVDEYYDPSPNAVGKPLAAFGFG